MMDLSGLLWKSKAKMINIIMWVIHLLLLLVGSLLTTLSYVGEPVLKVFREVSKPFTCCYKIPALYLRNKMEASETRWCKSKVWDSLTLRNGQTPCSYIRSMIVNCLVVENIDEMDDEGSRLASFSAILTRFKNADINVYNLSPMQLAQQGYFYRDDYIHCCFCSKRIHIDNVLLRNQKEHNQYCRIANEPPDQNSRYDALWDKAT